MILFETKATMNFFYIPYLASKNFKKNLHNHSVKAQGLSLWIDNFVEIRILSAIHW